MSERGALVTPEIHSATLAFKNFAHGMFRDLNRGSMVRRPYGRIHRGNVRMGGIGSGTDLGSRPVPRFMLVGVLEKGAR